MPTLKIRFPGGRYHATPWGHHVNEGLIEWPPSPWRLLRALIACGFSSQGWSEIPPTAQQLINKLAGVLPSYQLPDASAAHSRHFMPTDAKPTLVFDTWANVGDGVLFIHWPCELTTEETELLGKLASALGYLGRSESWVEAELVENAKGWNAIPCQPGEHRGHGWEQVSLMAAIPTSEYESWRSTQVQEAQKPFEGQKRTTAVKKKIDKALEPYPANLLACLTLDTAAWKQHGWSQPPGSQRVLYWRRSDALQVGVSVPSKQSFAAPVEFMLLALTTPSGNRAALPPVARTLSQAELFHRVIIAKAAKGGRTPCRELTGKDEHGNPLHDQHRHAHTIPLDLDGDGHLDHVLIYAKGKLNDDAQRAIRESRETWQKKGPDLQVAVVGSGDLKTLRQLPSPFNRHIKELLGPPEGSRVWKSATPFVLPKTLDRRSSRQVAGQVKSELASRGLATDVLVEIIPKLTKSLRHFVRRRNHGGVPPKQDFGYGLRLTFTKPQQGPLLLGYAAHYGLGLFVTVNELPDSPVIASGG